MSDTVAGTIHFKVNGTPYAAFGNWTIDLGLPKKSSLMAGNGKRAGKKEEHRPASLKGEMYKIMGVSVGDIAAIDNATITLVVGDGSRFVFNGANSSGETTYETEDGKISCEFEADDCTEIEA